MKENYNKTRRLEIERQIWSLSPFIDGLTENENKFKPVGEVS